VAAPHMNRSLALTHLSRALGRPGHKYRVCSLRYDPVRDLAH